MLGRLGKGAIAVLLAGGLMISQVASGATRPRDPLLAISATKAGRAGAADPSGVPMPKGNLPGWRQVYANDFTTRVPVGGFSGCTPTARWATTFCSGLPAAERKRLWAYPPSYKDSSGHAYNPAADLSITHGELDDYLHNDAAATVVPKINTGANVMAQGAYVVRFRADAVPYYKAVFLLWPQSQHWPQDGEIDFPEGDLTSIMTANMHWQGGTKITSRDFYPTRATFPRWHTAVTVWTHHRCEFFLDGKVVGVSTARIPDTPMYWVLQVETHGTAVGSGHLDIDWVAVYKPS